MRRPERGIMVKTKIKLPRPAMKIGENYQMPKQASKMVWKLVCIPQCFIENPCGTSSWKQLKWGCSIEFDKMQPKKPFGLLKP